MTGAYRQGGSALIISLVFLLLLTILGFGAMQGSLLQERMAGNARDVNIAFQAAEAALRAGEELLKTGAVPEISNDSVLGYHRQIDDQAQADYWMKYTWNDTAGAKSGSLKYTGSLGASGVSAPAEVPRYVIEQLASPRNPDGTLDDNTYYRITARGVGATKDSIVILQSVFMRP